MRTWAQEREGEKKKDKIEAGRGLHSLSRMTVSTYKQIKTFIADGLRTADGRRLYRQYFKITVVQWSYAAHVWGRGGEGSGREG